MHEIDGRNRTITTSRGRKRPGVSNCLGRQLSYTGRFDVIVFMYCAILNVRRLFLLDSMGDAVLSVCMLQYGIASCCTSVLSMLNRAGKRRRLSLRGMTCIVIHYDSEEYPVCDSCTSLSKVKRARSQLHGLTLRQSQEKGQPARKRQPDTQANCPIYKAWCSHRTVLEHRTTR